MTMTVKLTYFDSRSGTACGAGSYGTSLPPVPSLNQVWAEVAQKRSEGTLPCLQLSCDINIDVLVEVLEHPCAPFNVRLLRAEVDKSGEAPTAEENKFYSVVDAWLVREIPRLRNHEIESTALTLSIGNPGAREVILRASSQSVEIPRIATIGHPDEAVTP
jgi:hypothetical protein